MGGSELEVTMMMDGFRTTITLDAETTRRVGVLAEKTGEAKATLLRMLVREGLMSVPRSWGISVGWIDGEDDGTRGAESSPASRARLAPALERR